MSETGKIQVVFPLPLRSKNTLSQHPWSLRASDLSFDSETFCLGVNLMETSDISQVAWRNRAHSTSTLTCGRLFCLLVFVFFLCVRCSFTSTWKLKLEANIWTEADRGGYSWGKEKTVVALDINC